MLYLAGHLAFHLLRGRAYEPAARARLRSHRRARPPRRGFQLLLHDAGRAEARFSSPDVSRSALNAPESADAGHARSPRDGVLLFILQRKRHEVWMDFAGRAGDSVAGDRCSGSANTKRVLLRERSSLENVQLDAQILLGILANRLSPDRWSRPASGWRCCRAYRL